MRQCTRVRFETRQRRPWRLVAKNLTDSCNTERGTQRTVGELYQRGSTCPSRSLHHVYRPASTAWTGSWQAGCPWLASICWKARRARARRRWRSSSSRVGVARSERTLLVAFSETLRRARRVRRVPWLVARGHRDHGPLGPAPHLRRGRPADPVPSLGDRIRRGGRADPGPDPGAAPDTGGDRQPLGVAPPGGRGVALPPPHGSAQAEPARARQHGHPRRRPDRRCRRLCTAHARARGDHARVPDARVRPLPAPPAGAEAAQRQVPRRAARLRDPHRRHHRVSQTGLGGAAPDRGRRAGRDRHRRARQHPRRRAGSRDEHAADGPGRQRQVVAGDPGGAGRGAARREGRDVPVRRARADPARALDRAWAWSCARIWRVGSSSRATSIRSSCRRASSRTWCGRPSRTARAR